MVISNVLAPAPTRLRQIALVARDIGRARQLLVGYPHTQRYTADLGAKTHVIGSDVIYEDPAVGQWGLQNFLSMLRLCPQLVFANSSRSSTWR